MSTKCDLDINKPNNGPARVYTDFVPLDGFDKGVRIYLDWESLLTISTDEEGVEIVMSPDVFRRFARQISCCRKPKVT